MKQQLLDQLSVLLEEAELDLLDLELATQEMTVVRADGVASCLRQRSECYQRLRETMEEADRIAEEDESGALKLAMNPAVNFDDVPEEVQPLFEQRLALNAIICRILALEKQAVGHIELEREKLLRQIRENNEGQSAKASRFLGAVKNDGDRVFFPAKSKQI
ncbi:MAG: hypothetical protein E7501_03520 [Ruminococcus sp.]|nr:hypothetical protein [Ruminococcus sp.]